jgi:hypothetical protein
MTNEEIKLLVNEISKDTIELARLSSVVRSLQHDNKDECRNYHFSQCRKYLIKPDSLSNKILGIIEQYYKDKSWIDIIKPKGCSNHSDRIKSYTVHFTDQESGELKIVSYNKDDADRSIDEKK